jgi:hypothetical protein
MRFGFGGGFENMGADETMGERQTDEMIFCTGWNIGEPGPSDRIRPEHSVSTARFGEMGKTAFMNVV